MSPPIELPMTTSVVRKSYAPVTTTSIPVTTQTLPVVKNQYIVPQQPVYNTISTGSAGLMQPRPVYNTISARSSVSVPQRPVYSTITAGSNIPVQPTPVYNTISTRSAIPVQQTPVYTTISARPIAPVQSVVRPATISTLPVNPVASTPVLTQAIPSAPLTSIAAPVQSVVARPAVPAVQSLIAPTVQPVAKVTPLMNPTLGMTRPPIYSASTYRSNYNRNYPAYGVSSAARTNMMRPGPYTSRTYNARRL